MQRMLAAVLLIISVIGSLSAATPAGAAARTRCFNETGKCVSGPLLDYWEKNGGLAVFGYPIGDLITEWNGDGWNGPTQWFERDRLEDHGAQGVMAGRLGVDYLQTSGRQWQDLPKPQGNVPVGCRTFAETGHSLCGKMLEYWSKNGGLPRFGYPVSEPMNEEFATWGGTVQYFERRRMELHPENAGTKYEVLLGLLGSSINGLRTGVCAEVIGSLQKTAAAFGPTFECGAPFPQINVQIATEQFERGQMVWMSSPNGQYNTIYVFFFDNGRNRMVWQSFGDTWHEGDQVSGGEKAPNGLYEPIRGFGKIWRENPTIRNTLGWAVAPETADRGHLQYFRNGGFMLYRGSVDRVYLMYLDSTVDDIGRVK